MVHTSTSLWVLSELTASTCHSHLNSSWQTLSLSEGSCELSLHAKYLHVGQKNDLIVSEGLHQVLLNLWKFLRHLGQTRHFYCQPSTLRWWAIRGRYVYGGRNSSMKKVMWTVSWAIKMYSCLWSFKILGPPLAIHYPTTTLYFLCHLWLAYLGNKRKNFMAIEVHK